MFKKLTTILLMVALWLSLLAIKATAEEVSKWQHYLAESVVASGQGHYEEAIDLSYKAINAAKELPVSEREAATALAYQNIGTIYWEQGKYDEAEPILLQSINIMERNLPKDHPKLLMTYNNLANVYKDRGSYPQAHEIYSRVVTGLEKENSSDLPVVLDNWAENYRLQKDYPNAEKRYRQSLEFFEKLHGKGSQDTAKVLSNLATMKVEMGNPEEGLALYQQSLNIMEKHWPPEHPGIGLTHGNIGATLLQLRRFQEARVHVAKALEIMRKGLPEDHPKIALQENTLCNIDAVNNDYSSAEKHCLAALQIFEKKLGLGHQYTRNMIETLQVMYRVSGQTKKAAILAEKYPLLVPQIGAAPPPDYSGWEHVTPEGANVMAGTPRESNWEKHRDLSLRYMYQGQFTKSEAEIKRALETARESGEKESVLVSLRDNLGSIYRAQKKYDDALTEYQYSLDYQRKRPDQDRFALVITLANIGEVYQAQKNYPEAEKYLLEAISLTNTSMPMADIPYATLGFVYKNWGKPDKAETMLVKALELSKDKPAEQTREHRPGILSSLFSIYMDQGRFEDALPLLEESIVLAEESGSSELSEMRKLESRLKEAVSLKKWNWHMRNAQLHLKKQSPDQAEKHAQEALSLIRKLKPDSAEESVTLTVLGSSQIALQQFVQAKTSLSRAKTLAQHHYPSDSEPVKIISRLLETAQNR